MAAVDLQALEAGDNCAFFREQRDYEAAMVKKYNIIILCIAVAVAVALIGLIISIAINEWGVTAATGIGTVVSGAAMKFILDRRKEHQDRVNSWVRAIERNQCP